MSARDSNRAFDMGAVTDLRARAEAAEQRVADLEARIRSLADKWCEQAHGWAAKDGYQVANILWAVAGQARALVGDETPGTGEHA